MICRRLETGFIVNKLNIASEAVDKNGWKFVSAGSFQRQIKKNNAERRKERQKRGRMTK